jgi:serine/threonine protein kinase
MPAPTTVPEFLDLVRRSQLLPDARLDEVIDRHRSMHTLPQTIDQVGNLLVRESLLTFFQSKQLKLGRYKRFTIGSKYRLLELIGAGGMGAVYLCEHTLMRRLVALKVLPVEKLEDESNKERFYREARAVAALDHPNIVRAYDIDTYEKLHFLVMEYVDGTSLQEIVARYVLEKKQFDPLRAAQYIAQSAVGMQHAHELGMVHRDIKPGNLLLDRTGVIKVLDMGLARFFNKQQDSVTEKYDDKCVLGTADYLAPEQAVSNMVDIRADIYALGGTFYFMLTGHTPFPDGTIAAKLVAHQTREPRSVDTYRSDVPPGLLAVLRKMMAKDPADRYQEPIEVADALAEWSEQATAPPPPREMPIHCPLVLSLIGPATAGSGSGSTLARALFGPGRGVFNRAGGTTTDSRSNPALANAATYPSGGNGSHPNYGRGDANVRLDGPSSTARASTAATKPIAPPGSGADINPSAPGSGTVVYVTAPRRTGLYVVIGVLVGLLFVAGALAAYYIGKGGSKKEIPPTAQDELMMPKLGDEFLSPAEAAEKAGETLSVQFKVATTDGNGSMWLNSDSSGANAPVLSVKLGEEYFSKAGSPEKQKELWEKAKADYNSKVIRARGLIQRGSAPNSFYLEVSSPAQIFVVR